MRTLLSFLLLLMLVITPPAHADKQGISKQQAVSVAQQQHPGRVLAVKHSGNAYRVKILNANGEVRTIIVDAKSGNVVGR